MNRHPLLAPLALFLGAFLVSWIYQTPPSLGDDLNYWGLAMDLHQGDPEAWSPTSFHDLRWPIWGLCWLLQIPFGFSALSYYLQPMIYLGAGALVVFYLTLEVGAKRPTALLAGVLFLFHPQLDAVIDRPMPDLSEGFWVALAFFAWLRLMRSDRTTPKIALAVLVGLALAVGQANRITGVFAIPVLVITTLAFYPRQILWLALCGLVAACFVSIEAAIYHSLTGDWLHSLNANLSARGRKGTESIPLWQLPFRFIPSFYRRYSDVIFGIAALIGFYPAIRQLGKPGRALVAYAVLYLLTYSCALQSLFPPRPLVRDGDRFLASLAFPLSVLAALGLTTVVRLAASHVPFIRNLSLRPAHYPALILLLALGLVFFATRPFRGHNYLTEIREHLDTIPEGTAVLANPPMRHVVHMADNAKASRLNWTLKKDLLRPGATTRSAVESTEQIWFIRKWIWTGTRKKSEYDILDGIGEIADYLRPPLAEWTADLTVVKGDVPDFVFLKRRPPGATLSATTPDGQLLRTALFPQLTVPGTWQLPNRKNEPIEFPRVPLPTSLRGRTVFISLLYSSDLTEPLRANVRFYREGDLIQDLTIKPYLFPEPSEDFFFLTVPEDADEMNVRLRIDPAAKRFSLDRFDLLVENPPSANSPTPTPPTAP